MLRLRGIAMDTSEPEAMASFWAAALGYERRDLWEPYVGLRDPAGRDPLLTVQRTSAQVANHLHLDLYSDDPDAEAARLERLGATVLRRCEEGDVVVGAFGSDRQRVLHRGSRRRGPRDLADGTATSGR